MTERKVVRRDCSFVVSGWMAFGLSNAVICREFYDDGTKKDVLHGQVVTGVWGYVGPVFEGGSSSIPSHPSPPPSLYPSSFGSVYIGKHNDARLSSIPFDGRYRVILFAFLVTHYMQRGYSEDVATALAIADLNSNKFSTLLGEISTYEGGSHFYPNLGIVDLSYSFHSARLPSFSDYRVGEYSWDSFLTEDVRYPPNSAYSPFLVDPVIFNFISFSKGDYCMIGMLDKPYVFLVNVSNLSIVSKASFPLALSLFSWLVDSDMAVVVELQARSVGHDLVIDKERKAFGTRIDVIPFNPNNNRFLDGGVSYVFPVGSVVGFDIVDGKAYAATSFFRGNIQYTVIIDASSREILFREELDLSQFIGKDLDDVRVSPFTAVRFFYHSGYVVAGILHSHTLCTGETKNMITFCRHDSSESVTAGSATYYGCRVRQITLPDGYFSVVPATVEARDDGTIFYVYGYDAEDYRAIHGV